MELPKLQLEGLVKEYELIRGISDLVNGNVHLGTRPEIIAKAVRDGYTIPLKYTHSFQSLRSLYIWAVQNRDTEMIEWSTHQITSVLGAKSLVAIREASKKCGVSQRTTNVLRRDFLSLYQVARARDIDAFLHAMPEGSFWKRQLNRIAKANQRRCQMTGTDFPSTELLPLSTTLEIAFQRQEMGANPASLIDEAKVSGFVVAPALVNAHRPRMNWNAILRNSCLTRGIAMFKKIIVPIEVLEKLLEASGAPESAIAELQKRFG